MIFSQRIDDVQVNISPLYTAENKDGIFYTLYEVEALSSALNRQVTHFAYNRYSRRQVGDWPADLLPEIDHWPRVLQSVLTKALRINHFERCYKLHIENVKYKGKISHCIVTVTCKITNKVSVFRYDENGENGNFDYFGELDSVTIFHNIKRHWELINRKGTNND